ncbi:GNAT family N-acetyltransferase [Pseudidiomarina woesei]|uniref:Ribosomal protein S18 acetylase RimI and related acetyltransferases n=1 Tax=Pseudidiomarina woesei TaxID=1381080 RepID=A0A0K6H2I7_9GAMM|nr:GNAT family N-acetyltransferase [Pseudidiomarina woesei]CUA85193.1 Ribosomal protein S18 acetylase RimI and related acetyltransferases [Pseudidiomarina woesei]
MAEVRLAQAQDIAQIEALELATYAHEGYPAALFYQALAQWPAGFIVYCEADCVLGYLLAAPGQANEQWIMSVLIAEQTRGKGVGKQLLAYYLNGLAAKSESATQIKLTVAPYNHAAIALYEKYGFKKIDFLPKFLGPDADRILMALQAS